MEIYKKPSIVFVWSETMFRVLVFFIFAGVFADEIVVDVADCPPGYFCPAKSITPIPCPAGTWSGGGVNFCTPCEVGSYTIKAGSSFCKLCPQGHTCPASNASPEPCPLGTYNPELGQTTCLPCASGTYTPARGSDECTTCPAGSSCANPANPPEMCSPGMNIFLLSFHLLTMFFFRQFQYFETSGVCAMSLRLLHHWKWFQPVPYLSYRSLLSEWRWRTSTMSTRNFECLAQSNILWNLCSWTIQRRIRCYILQNMSSW